MRFLSLKKAAIAGAVAALVGYAVLPPPRAAVAQYAPQSTFLTSGIGGTANAVTLTIPNVSGYADLKGVPITFVPTATNTGPTTINVNGLGAVSVARLGGAAFGGGEIVNGGIATIFYAGSSFVLTSPQDLTPVGTAIDIRGAAAPTGYLIEDGSCVSQATYAALFAVIATNYNATAPVACSGGQFAVPFSNGQAFVALDNQGAQTANRITSAGSGCTATAIGNCGSQNQTLTLAQLPTGISSTSNSNFIVTATNGFASVINTGGSQLAFASTVGVAAGSQVSTSTNTSGSAHPILPPISLGRRAIKY